MTVPTRAPLILLGNVLPFTLATLMVWGRMYSRLALLRPFGLDDYLLAAAWLAALAECSLAGVGTSHGAGRHKTDIPPGYVVVNQQVLYGSRISYQMSLGLVKLSLAVFYLRVFNVNQAARIHIYALIAFVITFTSALLLLNTLQCIPPSKYWSLDPNHPGHCTDPAPGFWLAFACQAITDIWLLAFAAPRVWRLQMPRAQKIAILATLTLGWVSLIAAVIRAVRISTVLRSGDQAWVSYDLSIWSAVEINVSLICAAAPTLKPVFQRWLPGLFYSLSSKHAQSHKPPGHSERARWAKVSKGGAAYEMSRSRVAHHGVASHSQEELARRASQEQWAVGKLDRAGSDDDGESLEPPRRPQGDQTGITKSAQVKVSHWPLRSESPV
ncbi:hypothetical protein LTR53_003928 [Teratosphaeriaceae sp. CCFEE 6253]|nr:hypothetical protein LTR53_003928 [Teratosphaeriaceae sp. CCFEE 6253]